MTRGLGLAEYLWLAEQVTGVEALVLAKASRIELADSALHAPAASFSGEEFYPDLIDKAAVLTCRLARNHPAGRQQACRLGVARGVRRPQRRQVGPGSPRRRRSRARHARRSSR